jgi:hypothetical protein
MRRPASGVDGVTLAFAATLSFPHLSYRDGLPNVPFHMLHDAFANGTPKIDRYGVPDHTSEGPELDWLVVRDERIILWEALKQRAFSQ